MNEKDERTWMISFWEKDGGMREEYFSFFLKHGILKGVYFYLNNKLLKVMLLEKESNMRLAGIT